MPRSSEARPRAARTGLVSSPLFLRHDTGPAHPERPERLAAILRRLRESGLAAELDLLEPRPIERARLERVHPAQHLDQLARAVASGARIVDEGDTRVSADSLQAAACAAGGALQAVERVLAGEWHNAFVAARPPGHHAERAEAMGFCLYNNVALAAAHLRSELGLERVAIVDFDVHHGNGTQHIFEADPSVFYASLHQWPLYPGTGRANERGVGAGEGTTLNAPQAAGAGEREWLGALEQEILPALERFAPQFLLLSAGFDAHEQDPLAETRLTTDSYAKLTRSLVDFAGRRCHGRIVSLLEGGYDLEALAASAEVHLAELVRA